MSTASSTDGSSSVVATGPVWPPPSPPWTITASAPQPATFLACLAAPTDGITTTPASLSFAIRSGFGASANDATLTPSRISRSTRSMASPASARMLMPNGLSVAALTLVTAVCSSSSVMVADARMPRPPALEVADTSRAPATQPIPVCTTGCSMPTSSVSGVRSLLILYFLVPQRLRVDDLADQLLLVSVGSRVGSAASRPCTSNEVFSADLVGFNTWMQRDRPHLVVRAVEVEHSEVGHHPVHVDEPVRRVVRIDLVPTDSGHDVDRIAEHPLGVVADPVAGGVVDGVARAPRTPNICRVGCCSGPNADRFWLP